MSTNWLKFRSAPVTRLVTAASSKSEDQLLLILTLLIAALTGLVIVGFVAITERLGAVLLEAGPLQRFLSPVIGSFIGGWLLFRFFPEARGSGIPQTRVALLLNQGFISLRTVLGKFICSSISLGSGVALGREGPSVHIGAGLASVIGRNLGLSEQGVKSLIPVGTAAAVAAAFNTPLAAVLFTLEEILANLHARLIGSVVLGAATSWMVLRLLLGDEPIFKVPAYRLVHPVEFLIYILLGLAGGLLSTLFVKTLLKLRLYFLRTPRHWKPFAPTIGGLIVGTLAIFFPGVLGVGYHLVSDALNGQLGIQTMLALLVLKLIATSSSYSSGNAGGVFGPSLFIGAMLGGAVGQAAHYILPDYTANAGAYALVGMGACFAGIIRTPMTSVIMIFEITRDYTIIVPLMLANLFSYFIAQRLQPSPLYEALLAQEDIHMPSLAHRPEPLLVDRAMRKGSSASTLAQPEGAARLHADDSLDMVLQVMGSSTQQHLPVWSRVGNQIIGSIHRDDVLLAYQADPAPPTYAKKNWLPVLAVSTLGAIVLIAGLVVWQRSNRMHAAQESFQAGESLLNSGRPGEAVQDFRTALARNPRDNRTRIALGLALIQSGNPVEAETYLREALKLDPDNGPLWIGLARIAISRDDRAQAMLWMRQGLAAKWPPQAQQERVPAQLEYASLLYQAGRRNEATLLLLSLIEQSGSLPEAGKQAAALIRKSDSLSRAEEAYALLTERFPADPEVWVNLADCRLENNKDPLALQAYQQAGSLSPDSILIQQSITKVERILNLDPGRRGLSLRERARRWNDILALALSQSAACGPSPQRERASQFLAIKTLRLDILDEKMAAALDLWQASEERCKQDPILRHILSRLK